MRNPSHCHGPVRDQRAGLVTSYDSHSLAKALRELFENKSLYQELKAGCSEIAAEISWNKLIGQVQTSYEEVACQASPQQRAA